jgi:hypothetical protein
LLLQQVITKCKNLTTSFHHSSQLTHKLELAQKKECEKNVTKEKILRLIQEVVTRWHSLFLCLNRIKECHKFIKEVKLKNFPIFFIVVSN